MKDLDMFDWFQDECRKTAIYPKSEGLTYTALGLCGESGEYAERIKKHIRDGSIDDILTAKELSDVLWYVAMCAHELGYHLSEIAEMNLAKLKDRANRGVLGGSGDNR